MDGYTETEIKLKNINFRQKNR